MSPVMRTAVGRHMVSGTGSVSPGTEAWEQPCNTKYTLTHQVLPPSSRFPHLFLLESMKSILLSAMSR